MRRLEDSTMDQHPVIVADTSGVITEWNHAAETLFGYRADEAVGQSLDLVVPEHWRQAHWAGFHRALKEPKGKALPGDLPVRCADGKARNGQARFCGRQFVLPMSAFGGVGVEPE
jgi:PAS domain S-box-containing protein